MAREWLYGRQAVLASLRARRRHCFSLWLARGVQVKGTVQEILAEAEARACPVQRVEREAILKRVGHSGHQGVALEVSGYPYLDEGEMIARVRDAGGEALVLLLDHLQDPQNVGNVLRTAEIAGVTVAVMPRKRAVGVTPAVVNASAGAVEYLAVARVTNLVRAMEKLQDAGVWVYALEGRADVPPYWAVDLSGPVGIVVGSEGTGLSRLVREHSDGLLRIPMWGRTPSLNAAVAGALALYEVRRQRSTERGEA